MRKFKNGKDVNSQTIYTIPINIPIISLDKLILNVKQKTFEAKSISERKGSLSHMLTRKGPCLGACSLNTSGRARWRSCPEAEGALL